MTEPPETAGSAATPLVGREPELAHLRAFLDHGATSPCLVLVGEAGIGKTVLWEVGLDLARQLGYVVLSARASEAETSMSFAALADLVETVGSEVLASIPVPQLHALEAALHLAAPMGAPTDRFAVSAAFLSVVRALAARQPLLIAIDDVQWLDGSSTGPVTFAARRTAGHGVRLLLSTRAGRTSELENVLRAAGVERVEVGSLSFGAVSQLLTERLGLSLHRRQLRQLYETSGGNPLFAIELGRAMLAAGARGAGAALPAPRLVEDIFGERARALAAPARRVMLAVALSGRLTKAELAVLVDPLAVEDAIQAGLIVQEGAHLRAAHPLLSLATRQESGAPVPTVTKLAPASGPLAAGRR